jgi:tetratricopeptide (TPR) repeat protein
MNFARYIKPTSIAGLAALILIALFFLAKSLFTHKDPEIAKHFQSAIEYTNAYEFDNALKELDAILKNPKATKDEKDMATLMQHIVESLKKTPENTSLLDNINQLAARSGLVNKNAVEKARKKGLLSPTRQLELKKQALLKALNDLDKIDLTKLSPNERHALEKKRQGLLNQLKDVLDTQSKNNGNELNDASKYYQDQIGKLERESQQRAEKIKKEVAQNKKNTPQYKKNLRKIQREKRRLKALQQRRARLKAQREKQRLAEIKKLQQQKLAQQQAEQQRQAQSRAQQQQAEQQRQAQSRAQQQQAEQQRQAQSRAQQQQAEQQRQAQSRAQQQQAEQQRQAQSRAQQQQAEQQRQAQSRAQQQQAEQQRQAQSRAQQQQAEQQRQAQAKAQQQQAEQQRQAQSRAQQQHEQEINTLTKDLKKAAFHTFAQENYPKALELFDRVGKLAPKDADIDAMKSIIYLRQNKLPESKEALATALQKDKGEFTVPLAQAESDYANNNLKQAQANYQKSVSRGNNALANYRLGTIALKANNPSLASQYYDKAYHSPDKNLLEKSFHVKLTFNMGNSYNRMKKTSQTIQFYKEALIYDPSYTNASISLAQVYYQLGQYSQAVKTLMPAYNDKPKNPYILNLLGKSLHRLKRYTDSQHFFSRLVDQTPQDPVALYNLGSEQILTHNYDDATSNLTKSLSLKPDNNTKTQLGIALIKQKNYAKANQYFKEVLSDNKNDISALKGMAESYTAQKDYPNAISYLNQVIAVSPRDFEPHAKLGFIATQQNNYPLAITHFQKAFTLSKTGENAFQLANSYFKNKDWTNALLFYQQAYTLEKNPAYLEAQGNVYIQTKNYSAAKTSLTQIVNNHKNYTFLSRVRQKMNQINKLIATLNQVKKAA